MANERLGSFLKERRVEIERSLRWVERKSKEMYPDLSDAQISNGYLYQIEQGNIDYPHPLKLRTLARLYNVDYYTLLTIAGYIDKSDMESQLDEETTRAYNSLPAKLQEHVIKIINELAGTVEK